GRRDVWVLSDRQRTAGDDAGQDDHDRHHRREDRPVDEEIREHDKPHLSWGRLPNLPPAGRSGDLPHIALPTPQVDFTLSGTPDFLPGCGRWLPVRRRTITTPALRSARSVSTSRARVPMRCASPVPNRRQSLSRSTVKKNTGVKKMPNNVTPSMPLNTAVP